MASSFSKGYRPIRPLSAPRISLKTQSDQTKPTQKPAGNPYLLLFVSLSAWAVTFFLKINKKIVTQWLGGRTLALDVVRAIASGFFLIMIT
jgi:hypothetical protein